MRRRIEVLTKSNVGEFGPTIPSPPLLHDDDTLKEFLTLKCKFKQMYLEEIKGSLTRNSNQCRKCRTEIRQVLYPQQQSSTWPSVNTYSNWAFIQYTSSAAICQYKSPLKQQVVFLSLHHKTAATAATAKEAPAAQICQQQITSKQYRQ